MTDDPHTEEAEARPPAEARLRHHEAAGDDGRHTRGGREGRNLIAAEADVIARWVEYPRLKLPAVSLAYGFPFDHSSARLTWHDHEPEASAPLRERVREPSQRSRSRYAGPDVRHGCAAGWKAAAAQGAYREEGRLKLYGYEHTLQRRHAETKSRHERIGQLETNCSCCVGAGRVLVRYGAPTATTSPTTTESRGLVQSGYNQRGSFARNGDA